MSSTAPAATVSTPAPMDEVKDQAIPDAELAEAFKQIKIQAKHANLELLARTKVVFEGRHGREPTAEELLEEFRILRRKLFAEGSSDDEGVEYDIPEEYFSESEIDNADSDTGSVEAEAVPEDAPPAQQQDANPDGAEQDDETGSEADVSSEEDSDTDEFSLDEEEMVDVQTQIHEAFEAVSVLAAQFRQQLKSRVLQEYLEANQRDATADEVDAVLYDLAKQVWEVEDDESATEQSQVEPIQEEDDSEYVPSPSQDSESEADSVVSDPDELKELIAEADKHAAVVAITDQYLDGKPLPDELLEAAGVSSDEDATVDKPLETVVEQKTSSPVKPGSDGFTVTLWSGESVSVQLQSDETGAQEASPEDIGLVSSFLKMKFDEVADADWVAGEADLDESESDVSGLEDDEWIQQLQQSTVEAQ